MYKSVQDAAGHIHRSDPLVSRWWRAAVALLPGDDGVARGTPILLSISASITSDLGQFPGKQGPVPKDCRIRGSRYGKLLASCYRRCHASGASPPCGGMRRVSRVKQVPVVTPGSQTRNNAWARRDLNPH